MGVATVRDIETIENRPSAGTSTEEAEEEIGNVRGGAGVRQQYWDPLNTSPECSIAYSNRASHNSYKQKERGITFVTSCDGDHCLVQTLPEMGANNVRLHCDRGGHHGLQHQCQFEIRIKLAQIHIQHVRMGADGRVLPPSPPSPIRRMLLYSAQQLIV